MASALLASSLCGTSLPLRRPSRASFSARRPLVCRAEQDSEQQQGVNLPKVLTVPMAAALAGIMMTSAVMPDEALAARSSGRVGGSSFRSAPRAAPRMAPSTAGGPRVRNNTYNTYVAPPVGGYGYGGYGGFSFFPRPLYPVPLFGVGPVLPIGGLFSLMLTLFAVTAVFGVIRGALSKDDDKGRRDDWD